MIRALERVHFRLACALWRADNGFAEHMNPSQLPIHYMTLAKVAYAEMLRIEQDYANPYKEN